MARALCFTIQLVLLTAGNCDGNYEKQKYQVVMPRPQSHKSGSSELEVGALELSSIVEAAAAAGVETQKIVQAQLLSRLPPLKELGPGKSKLKVKFTHSLPSWRGLSSWEPIRQRDERYSLDITGDTITVDAASSWGLSNAMSTLYQLLEMKLGSGGLMRASIPKCPHHIVDAPAYPHRGLLLDTARTFYPMAWLKDLIVQLGEFKLNVLHLHLTDTSSWPLEVSTHPELATYLSYKDISQKGMIYSRVEVRDLVEFARLRGVSVMPEVDGPAHAPALASGHPLHLTVAANADFSTGDWAVEAPAGSWNFTDPTVTSLLSDVFRQLEDDFATTPYLHVGGDEPRASSLCEALTDEALKKQCLKECTSRFGGSPYAANCATVKSKPVDAKETFWFPEVLNPKIQTYFDQIVPANSTRPIVAWSGVRADMNVKFSQKSSSSSKPALQLWEFPQSSTTPGITSDDCQHYDLIQSSATHPQKGGKDAGWLYLECGEGQNWISMGQNYWCSRASWVTLYSQNLTQHYEPVLATRECQRSFIGAEIAIWGEITGTGNSMSLIFPRAVAFAERAWTNPQALKWDDLSESGVPPAWYWTDHLKGALTRLNAVVENLEMRGLGVSRLQPKFCFDHPEFCTNYTNDFLNPPKEHHVHEPSVVHI
jgi:hexosaminidase